MTKTEDRASRIRQRLRQMPAELSEQLQRMVGVRELLPGYVYHSRRRCGKPSCRCACGQLHEAWVLATKVNGKPTTRSLDRKLRGRVQRLADSYRRYRQAQRAVRKLWAEATELSRELQRLMCQNPL